MKINQFLPLLAIAACLSTASPCLAQQFKPKSIQFKGDTEYSDQELMDAAGLKKNVVLTSAEMSDHTQRLMDSGMFDGLSFKFDGQDLVFQINPAAILYPVRLDNLPLTPGPELDAKIHQQLPLYHGKVPSEGGMLDAVRTALQEQLAAEGIKATLATTPYTDRKLNKISAMSFSIISPPVVVGTIDATAGALDPKAAEVLASVTGKPYDREGSADSITRILTETYVARGYLEPTVRVSEQKPAVTAESVRIPFSVALTAGPLFKVTSIKLDPGMIVSQADFDKQSLVHTGDVADSVHIGENWEFLERQYHDKGFMKARIQATPTLDRPQNTVSYTVTAEPGPVYKMGTVTFGNVSEDLRAAMTAAWKMQPGEAFNEGYIREYFATHGMNPKLERVFAAVNIKYVLHLNDEPGTVDVVVRLEKKA